jgi:S-DNA-T family DNA segregation ATPase FtsK/SpoIIIE
VVFSRREKDFVKYKAKEIDFVNEIIAITLLAFGLLLLLALVSFDPADVAYLITPVNDPRVNFIGPIGAYISFGLFFSLGLMAYLLPLLMFATGIALIFVKEVNYLFKSIWIGLMILSGSCLIQLAQPLFPQSFFNTVWLPNKWTGGWVGYLLNDLALAPYIGNVGVGIVMGVLYVSSLILLFEIRPVVVIHKIYEFIKNWSEQRLLKKLEKASPMDRLNYEKQILEKRGEKLRKKLASNPTKEVDLKAASAAAKAKAKAKAEEEEDQDEDEDEEDLDEVDEAPIVRPAPRVIDTTISMFGKKAKSKKEAEEDISVDLQARYDNYKLPSLDELTEHDTKGVVAVSPEELTETQELLMATLLQFGIETTKGDITKGSTITRYEVYPAPGIRVEKIVSLKNDIARSLKAERVNILAPVPGRDTVGIEIPNNRKVKVILRELFESDIWNSSTMKLPIAIGKDVYGTVLVTDLAAMPHLLIAGSTGSGKSVCINTILMSLLYRFSPEDLRIILVDPKVVELQVYNTLPHLVVPVVTEPKKVLTALRWVINEMEKRYRIMAKVTVRNVEAFNELGEPEKEIARRSMTENEDFDVPSRLPYIVVIIDELADLMQTTAADVENAIARLSAKARAAGIHLIIATQTPRASVITGVIKTNVPCRIAFQVPSAIDSRVILDENGAENLLGKGDMLYLPLGSAKLIRAQGAFVSDQEVSKVVKFISSQAEPTYEKEIHSKLTSNNQSDDEEISDDDEELIQKCIDVISNERRASTSLLQRRLRIGYGRAAWVMDQLETRGIIGPRDGAKDREILINLDQTP